MKTLTTLFIALFVSICSFSQDTYFTRNANITFFSSTPLEDIKAANYSVTAVLDTKTGKLEFSALMKSFNFKKALMQEHFNENYVESATYPKSTFKGEIKDLTEVDFSKDGNYPVTVAGDVTLHGVTQRLEAPGTFTITDGRISASSKFVLKPEDFDIEIPAIVRDKIEKEIEVEVQAELEPLKR